MRAVMIFNPASGASMMTLNHGLAEVKEETILAELRAYHIEPEVGNTNEHDIGKATRCLKGKVHYMPSHYSLAKVVR